MSGPANFEGHEERECGEHRTTGARAWCFDCTEWCYPTAPCRGCELPVLRRLLVLALEHVPDDCPHRAEMEQAVIR